MFYKMKKLKYTIVILCLSMIGAGCDEFLEEKTRAVLAPNNFFTNDQEANIAINGVYRYFVQVSTYSQWSCGLRSFNYYGTDIAGSTTANSATYMEDYTMSETNYGSACGIQNTWRILYGAINEANVVLANVRGNGALSEEVRTRVEGEAIFLRAFAYYHLTNMWGDVPYYNEILDLSISSTLERSNVDQIRQELVDDLTEIETRNLLPTQYSGNDIGRVSIWAAKTLKAKIQLWQEDWAGALTTCEDIIQNSNLRLLERYEDVFDVGDNGGSLYTGELIWGLDFLQNFARGFYVAAFLPRPNTVVNPDDLQALTQAVAANGEDWPTQGRPQVVGLPDFAAEHPDDNRKPWNAMTEYEGIQLQFPYFWKLVYSAAVREAFNNYGQIHIVFRYADVVLMAAEAANEAGQPLSAAARDELDQLMVRAYGAGNYTIPTDQSELRQFIRDERRWELAGEGHRKYDLIRWGILVETIRNLSGYANPGATGKDNIRDIHVKLPIPDVELVLNPNLLQPDSQGLINNGYR